MTVNALDSAFGELLHLNLIEEFRSSNKTWTRRCLAEAYERALANTMRDGAPVPPEGSLEATILGLQARQGRKVT
jgi:hypothetical protein